MSNGVEADRVEIVMTQRILVPRVGAQAWGRRGGGCGSPG